MDPVGHKMWRPPAGWGPPCEVWGGNGCGSGAQPCRGVRARPRPHGALTSPADPPEEDQRAHCSDGSHLRERGECWRGLCGPPRCAWWCLTQNLGAWELLQIPMCAASFFNLMPNYSLSLKMRITASHTQSLIGENFTS